MLRRRIHAPASAHVMVLTIGLSVGVVATIFTAFDAVLLRDLIAIVVSAATLVPAARAMRTEPADLLREI